MAVEGVKKANLEIQKEIVKPKIEPKKPELANVDNKNTVVGDQANQGNLVKFKLNALYDGVYAAKQTPAQAPTTTVDPVKKADELINAQGGVNDLNEDKAYEIGRQIAELAKTDPEGAAAVMQEVQKRLDSTTYGDNAASGFTNNMSETELDAVARANGGSEMMRNLQDHLLSGRVHQNEVEEAQKLGKAISNANGIFTGNGSGVQPGQEMVTPYDPDATPEQAASFLNGDWTVSPEWKAEAFANALEMHKNDPEWIKNFLSAVGTDKAAEYISGLYNDPNANKDVVNHLSDVVRTTLEGLVNSGDLQQEGMNQLLDKLKDRSPYVFSEIFGKSTDDKFRDMFLRSAVANGDDRLEAAASYVLSRMSTDKQAAFLTELDQNGKLNDFIKGAMAGQQEIIPLDYHLENPNASWEQAPKMTLGGVTEILENAGKQAQYNGSTFQPAPYSQDLQESLFYAAAKGLTDSKAASNFESNVEFKDALSNVFLQHFDDIFKNSISPNGAGLNGDTQWLGAFFENTMFAQPPSNLASDVLATVYSKIAGIAKATDLIGSNKQPLTAEEQALVDEYRSSSPLGANWQTGQAAGVIGEWMGNFDRAYTNAVDKIKDDAAANKAVLDLFVGAVDKLTGLADLAPGANIAKDLLVDQLEKLPGYLEGRQIGDGKAEIEDSAQLITDLNNLIWDTIYHENQEDYLTSYEFITKHHPSESGLN